MPTAHGKDAVVKLDDAAESLTDISSSVTSMSGPPGEAAADEDTTLGSADKTYVGGLKDGTLQIAGVYNVAVDLILSSARGVTKSWEVSYDGGVTAYAGEGFLTSYVPTAPVGGIVTWAATVQISGGSTRT